MAELPNPMEMMAETLKPLLAQLIKFIFSLTFVKIVIFPGVVFLLVLVPAIIWFERKFIARVQMRVGPLYCGRVAGILQMMADGIKLVMKEILIPRNADKFFFMAVPPVLVILAGTLVTVIPFTRDWVIANLSVGLLFFFAIGTLFPSIVLIAGWASNSKYPFIGGLRGLFQQVSYEIPLWLSALGVVMLSGSLNLVSIAESQSKMWFILLQPVGFFVFLTAALAEIERIPFDLPEAESELVMGWMTEYSGMAFGFLFMGLYIKMFASACLATILFLGGWYGPPFLPPMLWFFLKVFVIITFIILVRGCFPRVRMDMLLHMGWTRLLGLAVINIFFTFALMHLGAFTMIRL